MTTTTIRVDRKTHSKLDKLARDEGKSIGQIVDQLLVEREKRVFFSGLARDFRRLEEDKAVYAGYQAELSNWDATLLDGLQSDDVTRNPDE